MQLETNKEKKDKEQNPFLWVVYSYGQEIPGGEGFFPHYYQRMSEVITGKHIL